MEAIGVKPKAVGETTPGKSHGNLLVELADEATVRSLRPRFDELRQKEDPEFDDVEISDAARALAPALVRQLSARQVANYVASIADFPDPVERLVQTMAESRKLRGKEWQALRDAPNVELAVPAELTGATLRPDGVMLEVSRGGETETVHASLAVAADGWEFDADTDAFVTTVPGAQMVSEVTWIGEELKRRGWTTAAGHYQQAVENFADGKWASANGQLRSFFESVMTPAGGTAGSSGSGQVQAGIDALDAAGQLIKDEGDYRISVSSMSGEVACTCMPSAGYRSVSFCLTSHAMVR